MNEQGGSSRSNVDFDMSKLTIEDVIRMRDTAKNVYTWLVPSMVFILLLAVIGNGLIVISSQWIKRPISSYNKLCISLALIDAWAAILLISGLVVNSFMPVVLNIQKSDECAAAVLEIFRISAMLTSNLHILALAIHHFVGILHPLDYKRYFTSSRQRTIILLFWILPLFYVLVWFISFPNDGFRNAACVFRFYYRQPFRFFIFISFLIPLIITFFVYIMILFKLLGNGRGAQPTVCDSNAQSEYQRRMKSKLKLIFTTMMVLTSFAISWGACLLYFVLVCKDGCLFTYLADISFETGFAINGTVNFMVALKLLVNPLIYTIRMRDFRKSVSGLANFIKSLCSLRRFSANSKLHTPNSELNPLSSRPTNKNFSPFRFNRPESKSATNSLNSSQKFSIRSKEAEDDWNRRLSEAHNRSKKRVMMSNNNSGVQTPERKESAILVVSNQHEYQL